MRKLSAAMCVLGGIGVALVGQTARAADGCSYNAYGQLYCLQGAQPGVPYGYYGDPYYRRHHYYRDRYYEPDPGAAVAMGILGAAAGAISHHAYDHRRRRHHHR